MNVYLSQKISDAPKVRTINGSPGFYAIQLSDNGQDSIHASRAEFAAWTAAVLAQMDAQ